MRLRMILREIKAKDRERGMCLASDRTAAIEANPFRRRWRSLNLE